MSQDNIEEMGSFFDARVESYDDHMRGCIDEFDLYYNALSEEIEKTEKRINILDLGCGTGAELEYIFKRAQNAKVTCVDLSYEMTEKLKNKYKDRIGQIEIIRKSYLNMELESEQYEYVISVMSMHHWIYDVKKDLYSKIRNTLKNGGKYIEGDYYTSKEKEVEYLKTREELLIGKPKNVFYHIDIPFSRHTQEELYKKARFSSFFVSYEYGGKEIHVGIK